ncbi:MAG TPA: CHRD domain-containing protein [Gemmatimonadaceae bacterium]|nr:CHRD domain-containing protein [Gemmatimonadaceae bacterium]
MRRIVRVAAGIIGAAVIAAVVVSCGDDNSTGPANKKYVANLNAAAEGGTITSAGSGVVTFEDKGDLITWSMTLTNMTNVTASHIHLGAATNPPTAGPVIINLFLPNRAPGNEIGTVNGLVAEGTITNANSPTVKLDSLRVLFNNGNSYANVHTAANPGGEIRDQIHPVP